MTTFQKELERLINCHSLENDSNTPDYVLAQYVMNCLFAFNEATRNREQHYGRPPRPSPKTELKP
jgi:hypothetical protein